MSNETQKSEDCITFDQLDKFIKIFNNFLDLGAYFDQDICINKINMLISNQIIEIEYVYFDREHDIHYDSIEFPYKILVDKGFSEIKSFLKEWYEVYNNNLITSKYTIQEERLKLESILRDKKYSDVYKEEKRKSFLALVEKRNTEIDKLIENIEKNRYSEYFKIINKKYYLNRAEDLEKIKILI